MIDIEILNKLIYYKVKIAHIDIAKGILEETTDLSSSGIYGNREVLDTEHNESLKVIIKLIRELKKQIEDGMEELISE